MTHVIGLISGTSVDGIDTVLANISGSETTVNAELLAAETYSYPPDLQTEILAVCGGKALSMLELAELDDKIAHFFARCALAIQRGNPTAELIGSHGQTIYHRPPKATEKGRQLGYSLQLGRGEAIAHLTGITTISNFRVADIAAGGQGAPLVPRADTYLFGHPTLCRCIQNLGGIGNLTYLPPSPLGQLENIWGWDTGPGNVLMDLAVQQFTNGVERYDRHGERAAKGTPCQPLVERWLQDPFFEQPPPKSTGREKFGSQYLQNCLTDAERYDLLPEDVLATLAELTVASIVRSYQKFLPQMPDEILLCGGGSRNLYLKQRLQQQLQPVRVLTTDEVGAIADFKEAIAFAILAYWRNCGIAGNLPSVTGACREVLLGEIHLGKQAR